MQTHRYPIEIRNRLIGGKWYPNGTSFPSKALARNWVERQNAENGLFGGQQTTTEYRVGEPQ